MIKFKFYYRNILGKIAKLIVYDRIFAKK